LTFTWNYNSDLFDDDTIERMSKNFNTLLKSIVKSPEQKIYALNCVHEDERNKLLNVWNATEKSYPRAICLHEMFEAQAGPNAHKVALVCGGQQLNYGELNQQANRLAHYLIAQGIKADSLVGVCMERSIEFIVALLGILKAGAAYIPIDPSYPKDRMDYMFEDSAASVILTQAHLCDKLPNVALSIIELDSAETCDSLNGFSVENIPCAQLGLHSGHLAYVVYTSGSTGQPKGVMTEHSGLVNYLLTQQEMLCVEADSRVLQFSSMSFVASMYEIWVALVSGSSLYLPDEETVKSADLLSAYIETQGISHARLPPSILPFLDQQALACVEHLKVTGESCPISLIKKWAEGRHLYNSYGATECSIGIATAKYEGGEVLPIGKPLANKRCYIVDEHRQLVPQGVAGELLIGGVGLARGYLNQPALTQEKFIPDPFFADSGLVYTSGDRVRWLSNGEMEFLGRQDTQVKVRGYRVELGEVESQLIQISVVNEAVVIAKAEQENSNNANRLVAYVSLSKGKGEGKSEPVKQDAQAFIHAHLKALLPEYMLPSAIVILDSLPLTPNGKVDRKSLPEPTDNDFVRSEYVEPTQPIEMQLCEIWQTLLGIEKVGIHDNFFNLGGDSIVSIQAVSRAKAKNIHFTVRKLFENQTIAELSQVVEKESVLNISQEPSTGQFDLLPSQIQFLNGDSTDLHHFNQAFLLETPVSLSYEHLIEITHSICTRHDALRLCFSRCDDNWSAQFNLMTDEYIDKCIHVEDMRSMDSGELEAKCNYHQRQLDLASGHLFRVVFFSNGDEPGRLLLIIHHMVVDGVSWRVLLSDLDIAYRCIEQGRAITLMPKTSSLQDWSKFIYQYSKSEELNKERDYWLNMLSTPAAPLTQESRGENETITMVDMLNTGFRLEEAETQSLIGECNETYRTQINELLLSALLQAIQQWSGQSSVRLKMESHGRADITSQIDTGETVGWFTAMYPLVLNCDQSLDMGEKIKSVKEQYRSLPNNGFGYGILKYIAGCQGIIEAERNNPTTEVIFNYLGQLPHGDDTEQVFPIAKENSGDAMSPDRPLAYLLNLNGMVRENCLEFSLTYSRKHFSPEQTEALIQSYKNSLKHLISYCCAVNIAISLESQVDIMEEENEEDTDEILI